MYKIPILFLIYRDPFTTSKCFNQIKKIKPRKLYIAADGYMPNKLMREECRQTRQITKEINWKCDLKLRFLKKNLGLKKAVTTSINWFFRHEEMGIILEYDCFADLSFFKFCDILLNKYKKNERIFSISGTNLQDGIKHGDGDYYFSNLFGCWGWATWKRAWSLYSDQLKKFKTFKKHHYINNFNWSQKTSRNIIQSLDEINNGKNKTTWSFHFEYVQLINGGITIVPNKNLVSNLGFGKKATNAKEASSPLAHIKIEKLSCIKDPSFMVVNNRADEIQLKKSYIVPMIINLKNLFRGYIRKILR